MHNHVRLHHIKYHDNFKINTIKACKSAMWLHIHPRHNGNVFMKHTELQLQLHSLTNTNK